MKSGEVEPTPRRDEDGSGDISTWLIFMPFVPDTFNSLSALGLRWPNTASSYRNREGGGFMVYPCVGGSANSIGSRLPIFPSLTYLCRLYRIGTLMLLGPS
jgi:hypothetical protein